MFDVHIYIKTKSFNIKSICEMQSSTVLSGFHVRFHLGDFASFTKGEIYVLERRDMVPWIRKVKI